MRFEDLRPGIRAADAIEAVEDGCNHGGRLSLNRRWWPRRRQQLRTYLKDPITAGEADALRAMVLKQAKVPEVFRWLAKEREVLARHVDRQRAQREAMRRQAEEVILAAQSGLAVAVLFRPEDLDFQAAFSNLLSRRDLFGPERLELLFLFSPPESWRQNKSVAAALMRVQPAVWSAEDSFDDHAAVLRACEVFDAPWDSLPALIAIAGRNSTTVSVCGTAASVIEQQLEYLAPLAGVRQPLHQDVLSENLSRYARTPPRLVRLGTGDPDINYLAPAQLEERRDFDDFEGLSFPRLELDVDSDDFEATLDRRIAYELPAYRLVAPKLAWNFFSAVERAGNLALKQAWRAFQRAHVRDAPLPAGLDGESIAFLRTSERVAPVLKKQPAQDTLDFSPAAQGLWKAFEREVNLSIVQVARKSRGARLPAFFALYDPEFPLSRSAIQTGTSHVVDLNEPEKRPDLPGRHRFLALGQAYFVKKTLCENPGETYEGLVRNCLGTEWPDGFDRNWLQLAEARNEGSHIRLLSKAQFDQLHGLLFSGRMLEPLVRIKRAVSAPS